MMNRASTTYLKWDYKLPSWQFWCSEKIPEYGFSWWIQARQNKYYISAFALKQHWGQIKCLCVAKNVGLRGATVYMRDLSITGVYVWGLMACGRCLPMRGVCLSAYGGVYLSEVSSCEGWWLVGGVCLWGLSAYGNVCPWKCLATGLAVCRRFLP